MIALSTTGFAPAYDKSGGYGLLDVDGHEKPTLLAALVRPDPEAVAGTPTSYAFAAGTFTMTYTPDRSITAPTVISVPSRVYPDGFTVDCDACTRSRWDR